MKKELPQAAVFGIIGVLVAGLVVGGAMFFMGGGPGGMSSEDVKRAQMEAAVNNQRMQGYINGQSNGPSGAPAAPGGANSPEAQARAQHPNGQ